MKLTLVIVSTGLALLSAKSFGSQFTPLVALPPKAVSALGDTPGNGFPLTNFFDANPKTEYASHNQGTNTVIQIEFTTAAKITAIRHVDRNDRATVAESQVEALDENGKWFVGITITHTNRPRGETFLMLPTPITAKTLKWHVTKIGDPGLLSVGGAELAFLTSEPTEHSPKRDTIEARVLPFLDKKGSQGFKVLVEHPYAEPATGIITLPDKSSRPVSLKPGSNEFEWQLRQVNSSTQREMTLKFQDEIVARKSFVQNPVRHMTIYILPHSHTDIGYTEIQSAIEKKQVNNVLEGIAAARKTASYPDGARFVWNIEVGWAADLFLQRMNEEQRGMFFDAVKKHQVVLNGMYLNELTGLCRPEELVQLFRFATKMSEQTGVPIEAAMISDVPGYTWGLVPAMSQAGIRYMSAAPNYFDRIGTILREWENKPFYWEGPDGHSKVLVWIPFWGYAMSHIYHELSLRLIDEFYAGLEKRKYPYDIAYVRWSGHGDNAVPDPAICDFIKDWNAQYEWPKFIISGTAAPFQALEERYGKEIPTVRGDWSPYWEDGAGSSALETAQNRASSDRLDQAAAAFTIRDRHSYPVEDFNDAWRDVLLYSEHTWGAWCSISGPERKETIEQWAVKKSYADQADARSRKLLQKAVAARSANGNSGEIEVINTLSWRRTDLVTLPRELSSDNDQVTDDVDKPVPSQRLSSGELVFRASNIPALGERKYRISRGPTRAPETAAQAHGSILDNGLLNVRVDEKTGSIVGFSARDIKGNLADEKSGGLNHFQYLVGDDPRDVQGNGPVKIAVGESGPLVASLIIESPAPGCKLLRRELRLVAGEDSLLIINTVDKERLAARSYSATNGKESLNFAFPFNVPNGDLQFDVPFGVVRPDRDQLPSACKNWLTVGRWADVANDDFGLTWVTLDAPLIEPGYLSATLLNSQTNPDVWRKQIGRTQKIYSWAMNNHWGTNYRAYQEGPTVFRYILRAHGHKTNPADNSRFSTAFSQPLLAAPSASGHSASPLFSLSSPDVLVTGLKPSDDGKAIIVRLFEASGKKQNVSITWGSCQPKSVYVSNTSERPCTKVNGRLSIPAFGLITLRAEL